MKSLCYFLSTQQLDAFHVSLVYRPENYISVRAMMINCSRVTLFIFKSLPRAHPLYL